VRPGSGRKLRAGWRSLRAPALHLSAGRGSFRRLGFELAAMTPLHRRTSEREQAPRLGTINAFDPDCARRQHLSAHDQSCLVRWHNMSAFATVELLASPGCLVVPTLPGSDRAWARVRKRPPWALYCRAQEIELGRLYVDGARAARRRGLRALSRERARGWAPSHARPGGVSVRKSIRWVESAAELGRRKRKVAAVARPSRSR